MRELLSPVGAHLRAAAAVVVAAVRLRSLDRELPFDDLVADLRRRSRTPGEASPRIHARVVGPLLPFLPPWRMGRCLKRSLILLHLWSGIGLDPRLHVGVRGGDDGAREGHAWLTVDDSKLQTLAGSAAGCESSVEL